MTNQFSTDTLKYATPYGNIKSLNCHYKTEHAQFFSPSLIKINDKLYTIWMTAFGLMMSTDLNVHCNWFNQFSPAAETKFCELHDEFKAKVQEAFGVEIESEIKLVAANLYTIENKSSWFNHLVSTQPERVNQELMPNLLSNSERDELINLYLSSALNDDDGDDDSDVISSEIFAQIIKGN